MIESKTLDDKRVIELMTKSDIAISFASPWIFKKEHIDLCKEIVNVHLTELPKWKGAASVSWKILCGERSGGATIHRLTTNIDEGDILFQKRYDIPYSINTPKEIYNYGINKAEKNII